MAKKTVADKSLRYIAPKRKRKGRHAKKTRPSGQTFFTNGRCR
jgi:hypothetical protein